MIPSVVASEVRASIEDFLKTEFRPASPGFEGLMQRFLATQEAVFKGPYLSVGLPFRPGSTGADYFPDVPMAFPPHRHQEQAFARLKAPYYQSTLVATGTGSGKTECFLLPILNHCYQQESESGIKALLIYPMNALATDQAKRLASLIWHNPKLKGKVTAGLFVGESERDPKAMMGEDHIITDKNILRQCPPDILLTNYKMLDYLLIRPGDQPLWTGNAPETLRYLVVDEIHTFDGAQGTDLACLIRRLKARLQTPERHLACVGTSATLGGSGNKGDMLNYATTVFDEPFDQNALVEEDRLTCGEFLFDAYINPLPIPEPDKLDILKAANYQTIKEYICAQHQLWFEAAITEEFNNNEWRVELGDRLKSLPIVHNLLKVLDQGAIALPELWQKLSRKMRLPDSDDPIYQAALFDSLIALCAIARRQLHTALVPWVNIRLQFWLRELRRMVGTVEKQPQLVFADDQASEEKERVLPVIHCRDCGSTGWGGLRQQVTNHKIACDLRDFYKAYFANDPLITYIFPHRNPDNDRGWLSWKLCKECLTLNRTDAHRCSKCASQEFISVIEPDQDAIVRTIKTKNGNPRRISNHDCPFCGSKDGLAILGSRAASLASAAIGTLFSSAYNDDRKLITFSDSVQDAAHRAGFFETRTFRTTLRSALRQHLDHKAKGWNLADIRADISQYWRNEIGGDGDYIATFMPSDLEWLREWEELQQAGTAKPSLVDLINKRLDWEVIAEIGLRTNLGASLERTDTCAIYLDSNLLNSACLNLLEQIRNEIGGLENLDQQTLLRFLLGLIYHLRLQGGILHSVTENYIESGGQTFRLQQPLFMPGFGPSSLAPVYFVQNGNFPRFEALVRPSGKVTWCENWAFKLFSSYTPLIVAQVETLYNLVLNQLVSHEIFGVRETRNGAKVWGIEQTALYLDITAHHLECDKCGHSITASPHELTLWTDTPCMRPKCTGKYQPSERKTRDFYRHLYSKGRVWRIFAREHTGLLERDVREELETRFITGRHRYDPNLLSATSTLEMGIDIGTLSSVLLCSVPPAQANYQQRIGRAGRRDGNAFIAAIANGTPHDLYFWADPMLMIAGGVDTPGSYLDASAILQRQLTAYCLDRWVSQGITPDQLPERFGTVLDSVQQRDLTRFPYTWLDFIENQQLELLQDFLDLFQNQISHRSAEQLRIFIEKGENDEGGLRWRIVNRLQEVVEERRRLKNQSDTLRRRIKDKEKAAKSQNHEEELAELHRERGGLMELVKNISDKNTLNFFTDEGLLPNYAFPEPGVMLKSIIWRQKNIKGDGASGKYETFTFEYERPGAIALRELAPSGVFYAEGNRVKIDQIDLNISQIEEWRLCRNCSYAALTILDTAKEPACPRCGDRMWSDAGRKRKMIRLRQVIATTNARESRIGDDKDERQPAFFTQQMLVDFEPEAREKTFVIKDEEFPFGFEFISRVTFREVNFGEGNSQSENFEVAGINRPRPGFQICRHCGKVQTDPEKPEHALTCSRRENSNENDFTDILYLFRQFESEAIRILLPVDTLTSDKKLHSFIAALQLGLKQYFKGKVDHLRTLISHEPQENTPSLLRKPFLFLYDTIPGGTGYLRELLRDPNNFFSVFEQALVILRACDCNDGCYNCLYGYRNSFDRDQTSRKTAIDLLNMIVNRRLQLTETQGGLSQVKLNALFDSILELRFIEALRRYRYNNEPTIVRKEIVNGKAGYFIRIANQDWNVEPQVELGRNEGIEVNSRADFVFYPAKNTTAIKPIVIFTDGWQYHAHRIAEDFLQRMAIAKSNQYHVWSLTWTDVESQFSNKQNDVYVDLLELGASQQFKAKEGTFYEKYKCGELRLIAQKNSFIWLVNFLVNPNRDLWKNFALMRTSAQFDNARFSQQDTRLSWVNAVLNRTNSLVVDAFKPIETGKMLGLVSEAINGDKNLVEIYISVEGKRHSTLDSAGSFITIYLDDKAIENEKELQKSWIGVLRYFNILQFLDHSYVVTAQGNDNGLNSALVPPKANQAQSQPTVKHNVAAWQKLEELVFDETTLELLHYMQEHNWDLPEVGYELIDSNEVVIAEAELAWTKGKCAVLITADNTLMLFKAAGWQVATISEVMADPETFYSQYIN
ncbi:DEAD/DEAH box helicase [Nostoc parmelioides]|uniref:DEAD/DEAH box helicase n=1 Tax=Nostoc parmelioides FACHB-3921 TaxID=2692909 RepID=A0ABR8BMV7_9NOSO|nr:DEAD/DEAH box helicase [Nostoc parmelioides]MBD2255447.1 DEAD/DEAH box helicase [Nostoc parmelioides FACHB-3921]